MTDLFPLVVREHRLPTSEFPKGLIKVAVLGGNGFLGRHFISKLARSYRNLDIFSLDRNPYGIYLDKEKFISPVNDVRMNLSVEGNIHAWMLANKPDVVVFMAGREGPAAGLNPINTTTMDLEAVVGLDRTLAALHEVRPFYFLYVSSSAVYGNHGRKIVTETSKLKPDNHVGQIRVVAEQRIREFCDAVELEYSIVRPSQIFGNHHWRELLDDSYWAGYISYYVDKVLYKLENNRRAVLNNKDYDDKFPLMFSPNTDLDFVHVDYVVETLEHFCMNKTTGTHNIFSGNHLPLKEVVSLILDRLSDVKSLPYDDYKQFLQLSLVKKDTTKLPHDLLSTNENEVPVVYDAYNKHSVTKFINDNVPVRMVEIREHEEYKKAIQRTNVLDTTGKYKGYDIDKQRRITGGTSDD